MVRHYNITFTALSMATLEGEDCCCILLQVKCCRRPFLCSQIIDTIIIILYTSIYGLIHWQGCVHNYYTDITDWFQHILVVHLWFLFLMSIYNGLFIILDL